MNASHKDDVVSATILQSKCEAVVAEMERALINTAYSSTISEAHQCAAALFTESGQLVAVTNPIYMYPLAMTVERIIDRYQYDLSADDVLITNDPYGGGTRVQNFTVIAPVSDGDSIALYVAVCGQTEDFGGDVRGNLNPRATEIWAEGARCTPVRLVRDGKFCKDVMQTLALNSRNPEAFALDIEAMRAAVGVGRQRIAELLDRNGTASLVRAMEWVLNYSERRIRALVGRIPEGIYHGESMLAHDGSGREGLNIRLSIAVERQGLAIDFQGSDPQSTGYVNASPAVTATFAVLPLIAAFGGEVPCNAGLMRCITIRSSEGSLVNPTFPAPVGWGQQHVGNEISEAVSKALAQAIPDQVSRITANSPLLFSVHKMERHGQTLEQIETFDFSNFIQGDANATPDHDGWGMPGIAARVPLPSVELFESDRGGLIEQMEFVVDSAGAGSRRGSPGTLSVISLPHPADGDLHLTAMVVPQAGEQEGGEGGLKGSDNAIVIDAAGERMAVDGVLCDWKLTSDARITLVMGGGNGWGAPQERDPKLVLADVAGGLVSLDAARRLYNVVIDPETLQVDEPATERLRAAGINSISPIEERCHG